VADRSLDQYQAIVLHDERFNASTLDDKTGTPASTYTQAGPVAGVPEDRGDSAMVLHATGVPSQDGNLQIIASRAGLPDDRAELVWRDVAAGDGADEYKGWEGPELVTGWEALESHTLASDSAAVRPSIIPLQSGGALATVGQAGTSAGGQFPVFLARYRPATGWASLTDLSPGNGATQNPGLIQLPDEKVLVFLTAEDTDQVDVRVSDDDGDTWAPYSLRVLGSVVPNTDVRQIAVAYSARQICLLVGYHDGSTFDMAQYASSDMGKSFDLVTASYKTDHPDSDEAELPSITGVDAGGFVIVYKNNQTAPDRYERVVLPDAFTAAAGQSKLNIGSTGANDIAACDAFTRPNGDVLLIINEDHDEIGGDVTLHWSADGGTTISKQRNAVNLDKGAGGSGNRLYDFAYAEAGGRGLLLCRWETSDGSNSYADHSLACCYLGGFSTMTQPAADIDSAEGWGRDYYPGFPAAPSGQVGHGPWLPIGDPGSVVHATTGAGGTVTMTAGKATLATTAASRYWTIGSTSTIQPANAGNADAVFAEVEFAVTVGGNQSAFESGFEVRHGGGGKAFELQVRADTAGFVVYDNGGTAARATVAIDMTTARKFRVVLDAATETFRLWYSTVGHIRTWTEGASGAVTDTTGTPGVTHVTFGHHASTTSTTDWFVAGIGYAGVSNYAPRTVTAVADGWSNPEDLSGLPASARPQYMHDDVRVAAIDGPACVDDSWALKAAYQYPAKNVLPTHSSSPGQPWKSVADGSEMHFVFDIEPDYSGDAGLESKSLFVGTFGSWIQEFYFDGHDGASWNQLIHAEAFEFFDGLKYQRTGRVVAVDTGQSQTAERYFFREAHAGDVFDFGTTDPYVLRPIKHNAEGAWTDSTTVRPSLVLDEDYIDGTEPSSGTGRVWRRNFGGVTHVAAAYEKYRIRIPSHKAPGGQYKVGTFFVGPVAVFGTPTDRGFSNSVALNVDYADAPSGRRTARRRGPPRRSIEFALANTAVDLSNVQSDSPVPHYVTPNGSAPVAAVADTTRQIEGLILRAADEGLPVVYIARLDKLDGANVETFTEPDRLMYGRLRTDPRRDHVVGVEGSTEVERLNTVTIEEEV